VGEDEVDDGLGDLEEGFDGKEGEFTLELRRPEFIYYSLGKGEAGRQGRAFVRAWSGLVCLARWLVSAV
jgi:hypothetical protein